jgi:hypothetical protein
LKAVISLSPDSRPKVRRIPRRTAVGIVRMRKEAAMKRKTIKMFVTFPPPLIINSISLKILSIRRIIVKVISPMKKMGRISFQM